MAVLEMIAVAGRGLTAADVQKATELPRPTCYRLLQTLVDNRLVDDPDRNSHYVIGERLVRIALLGKSDIDVRSACAASLKAATARFGEAVFLARFRSRHVEIIQVELPVDASRGYIHPGQGVRPMHACSCSKAIAAFAEWDFQKEILRGDLKAYTEHTRITRESLQVEFAKIVKQGYAECDQELEIGVSSVAAPIRIGHVGASFSVGVVGPIRRFSAANRKRIGKELKQLATRVSAAIQLSDLVEVQQPEFPLVLSSGNENLQARERSME